MVLSLYLLCVTQQLGYTTFTYSSLLKLKLHCIHTLPHSFEESAARAAGRQHSGTSLIAAMSEAEEMEHEAGEDEEQGEDEQGEDERGEGEEHNEYERERAARIAENMAKLQALGVSWWCMGMYWAPPCFSFMSMQHSITLDLWRTLVGSTWAAELCSCLGVTDHVRSTQLSSPGTHRRNGHCSSTTPAPALCTEAHAMQLLMVSLPVTHAKRRLEPQCVASVLGTGYSEVSNPLDHLKAVVPAQFHLW